MGISYDVWASESNEYDELMLVGDTYITNNARTYISNNGIDIQSDDKIEILKEKGTNDVSNTALRVVQKDGNIVYNYILLSYDDIGGEMCPVDVPHNGAINSGLSIHIETSIDGSFSGRTFGMNPVV